MWERSGPRGGKQKCTGDWRLRKWRGRGGRAIGEGRLGNGRNSVGRRNDVGWTMEWGCQVSGRWMTRAMGRI